MSAWISSAKARLVDFVRPEIVVTPPVDGVVFDRDVEVPTRDKTVLRVNVFRPAKSGKFPVLMSAHPYGKDVLPTPQRDGTYGVPFQYRLLPSSLPVKFSAWTSWEAPDPCFWVPSDYVVVNADLRGFGRSDGEGAVLSAQEGLDYYDLIEWAAKQPWSTGNVGLCGVSYLAISQWRVASLQPPWLKAICPWEGFTDAYRDFFRPGGIREDGFSALWSKSIRRGGRVRGDLREEQKARVCRDDWWDARDPVLENITVPALVCGSFSDQNLHSRGSFEGFRRVRSAYKYLYTHRGPKWATFYSEEAKAFQKRFFDCFLKGEANGMRYEPAVRWEVRERGDTVHSVRKESTWPLARTKSVALYLRGSSLVGEGPGPSDSLQLHTRKDHAHFDWVCEQDTEISGTMKVELYVRSIDLEDFSLFVGVRKLDANGNEVHFEGSYGFTKDLVTRGWLKVSHRALDAARTTALVPVHSHEKEERLSTQQLVRVELELLPSATLFRANEVLRLVVQGTYFFSRSPVDGQFPCAYEPSPEGHFALHLGEDFPSRLVIPTVPLE